MTRFTVFLPAAVPALGLPAAPAAPAAPAPKQGGGAVLYFPTEVGAKVVRRFPDRDEFGDSTLTVTAVEAKAGGKLGTVSESYTSAGGVWTAATYDLLGEKWEEFDPPHCLLKLPANPGDQWTHENPAEKYKVTCTVGKPERVEVPAGAFDAVVVRAETSHKGEALPRRACWFAPGVGQVKTTVGDKVGVELMSFTPAKK